MWGPVWADASGDEAHVGKSLEERFWAKVNKDGPLMTHMDTACWLWTGATNGTRPGMGHGSIFGQGRKWYVHRLSYLWHYGELPKGMEVEHRCHQPPCVNPQHLRLTTRKQNMENRSGPQSNTTSGVLGVSWDSSRRKWAVEVVSAGEKYWGGRFNDLASARTAAVALRNKLYTHNELDRSVPV